MISILENQNFTRTRWQQIAEIFNKTSEIVTNFYKIENSTKASPEVTRIFQDLVALEKR